MPFERLKAIVFADIRERGLPPERLDEYTLAWAASATPQARAPMPCPACFARGKLAGLKGRSVADGYAAAVCSQCDITFQFSKGPGQAAAPLPTAALNAASDPSPIFLSPTNDSSTGAP